MDSEEKKPLLPFDLARLNITETAENFNFYNSVEILALAIQTLNSTSDSEHDSDLDMMCQNIIKELSLAMIEKDDTWN